MAYNNNMVFKELFIVFGVLNFLQTTPATSSRELNGSAKIV